MTSLWRRLIGKPRSVLDPSVFHRVSLIAFFAWVGLGADGLSSSAYGPEEAFRHLGEHQYLAVFLALATALTVFIISYAYSRIIEQFPGGGGGYLVATKLLGPRTGVVSGSALLVDYVLTISISVASGVNAIFAFLPGVLAPYRVPVEVVVVLALIVMNLRGVKESVLILTPIFLVFVVTHVGLIVGTIVPNLRNFGAVGRQVHTGLSGDLSNMSVGALLLILARAYSLGGGTYTGIEATSNGLAIMREPRVVTGRRTMVYMAISLAFTAGGILLAYLLLKIQPNGDEPMNATLVKHFVSDWRGGQAFVVITMFSEGALLFVAAQAGFIDGPRVMANMALDSWMPHQLASLSERLTTHNGVYLMGGAAIATLFYTHGDVHHLVVMYSINVFLTFSLSNLGMSRLWIGQRRTEPLWWRRLTVHLVGLALCAGILVITVIEKFTAGGWVTLVVTSATVTLCFLIRAHYRMVGRKVGQLDRELLPEAEREPPVRRVPAAEMDPAQPTAVLLVGGYGGLGLRALRQIERTFPGQYRQVVFLSAAIVDSGTFKGREDIEKLTRATSAALTKYVAFARTRLGWAADSDMTVGTDVVAELERLCRETSLKFPRSVFFAGKLIFHEPKWWQRFLHNETANAVQRRLEFDRLAMVILPVRMLAHTDDDDLAEVELVDSDTPAVGESH